MPKRRTEVFCPGCGERKRLRWPINEPEFCSKDCAAWAALTIYGAGSGDFHCAVCSDVGCQREHAAPVEAAPEEVKDA